MFKKPLQCWQHQQSISGLPPLINKTVCTPTMHGSNKLQLQLLLKLCFNKFFFYYTYSPGNTICEQEICDCIRVWYLVENLTNFSFKYFRINCCCQKTYRHCPFQIIWNHSTPNRQCNISRKGGGRTGLEMTYWSNKEFFNLKINWLGKGYGYRHTSSVWLYLFPFKLLILLTRIIVYNNGWLSVTYDELAYNKYTDSCFACIHIKQSN